MRLRRHSTAIASRTSVKSRPLDDPLRIRHATCSSSVCSSEALGASHAMAMCDWFESRVMWLVPRSAGAPSVGSHRVPAQSANTRSRWSVNASGSTLPATAMIDPEGTTDSRHAVRTASSPMVSSVARSPYPERLKGAERCCWRRRSMTSVLGSSASASSSCRHRLRTASRE